MDFPPRKRSFGDQIPWLSDDFIPQVLLGQSYFMARVELSDFLVACIDALLVAVRIIILLDYLMDSKKEMKNLFREVLRWEEDLPYFAT